MRRARDTASRQRSSALAALLAAGGAILTYSFVFVLGVGAAPRAQAAAATDPPVTPADAERTYQADCAVCHGANGAGTASGPRIAGVGRASVDYYLSTGRMPLVNEAARDPLTRQLRPLPGVQLGDPSAEPHRREPAYPPAMIAALVAYVHGFQSGGVDVPDVTVDPATRARGGEIYRQQCAACHAWSGDGGALYQREAPSLHRATPVQIAEAVRVGPGAMPAFGVAAVPPDDLNALVSYVRELDHPEDRGGQPIWHLGPVAEGGVAILVGLALLVICTRLIGSRG